MSIWLLMANVKQIVWRDRCSLEPSSFAAIAAGFVCWRRTHYQPTKLDTKQGNIMTKTDVERAREEALREDEFEQRELSARHRPDERAPNEPAAPGGSGDAHAAGTAGGGTAVGGLAGTNVGDGSVENADIDAAAGSGNFDVEIDADDEQAYAGHAGGAMGGTPAGKRARGGRTQGGISPA